jgi:ABC-type branched-subunit amino acid transport system substrate-binding protein
MKSYHQKEGLPIMKSVRRLIVVFPALLSLLLGACSMEGGQSSGPAMDPQTQPPATAALQTPPMQTPPAGQTPIKVAILLPLSGPNKALGEAMLNAAQMALFDLGSTAFELIPRDTKNTPADAALAAQSAISAGAQLILGPVFAQDVRAVQPLLRQSGINLITFSTDWSLASGNTFVMGFLPFDQVERVTGFAAAAGIKSAAILSASDTYGRSVSRAFANAAAAKGLSVATTLTFPHTQPDLTGIVQSLARTQRPMQAVFMPLGGQQALTLANVMSTQGLTPERLKRIGTGLFDDGTLMRSAHLDGAWFAAPSPRARARFVERYRSTYGSQPPRLSTLAYDATALAVVLSKRSHENGNVGTVFARSAITNPNGFSGIDGIFRFRPDGTAERGLAVLEFKNGEIVVIDEAPQTFQMPSQ